VPVDHTFVVVSTAYVVPPRRVHREPFTEIVLAADQSPDAARYVYATRDPLIEQRAIEAEGHDTRFHILSKGTLEGLKREYRALVSLEPVRLRSPYRRRAS
jgi:hypothetical protein